MSQHSGFRTPRQRATGLGPAGEGVGHWWASRLTSIALVPLGILFIFPWVRALGDPYADVLALYSRPFPAAIAILFIGVTFYHIQQGMQVVIEDYVSAKPVRTGLLIATIGFCWLFGLIGVLAVLRLAFAG
jgi:succinate dehydrogenase / fumarate reductase, membrane anchor subunit